MTKFVKTGSRTGIVLSLTAAALIAPQVILAGPGCMNNQRMSQGYYPYSPMRPQMAYGQRMPYSYYPAPAPQAGMMAAPYNRPMTASAGHPRGCRQAGFGCNKHRTAYSGPRQRHEHASG